MKVIKILFFWGLPVIAFAQSVSRFPVAMSPGGPVLFLDQFNYEMKEKRDHRAEAYRISIFKGKSLKVLGEVRKPAAWSEFRKYITEGQLKQLKQLAGTTDEAMVWQFILAHPDKASYGFLALDPLLLRGLGLAFTDQSNAETRVGEVIRYRIEIIAAKGEVLGSVEQGFRIPEPPVFSVPAGIKAIAADSLVYLEWAYRSVSGEELPLFASVYRETGGNGKFILQDLRLAPAIRNDSVFFQWHEKVRPDALYRYFLRLTDVTGNVSQTKSDTLAVVPFRFSGLSVLNKASAKDTMGTIQLSWEPVSPHPAYTGVEIQRSAEVLGNYMVLDTLPADAVLYTDHAVLPNTVYYYRLRLLTLNQNDENASYSAFLSASVRNLFREPDSPYQLTSEKTKEGHVRLTWQKNADLDFFAYYVFRGTSAENLAVISGALKDTVFTDTESDRYSAGAHYIYAVRAVNISGAESQFSAFTAAYSGKNDLPAAPSGIMATPFVHFVRLHWEDIREKEAGLAGYILYKKRISGTVAADTRITDSAEALKLGFEPVERLFTEPFFEDRELAPGQLYQYAVSAIDLSGGESTLSPVTTTGISKEELSVPSEVLLKNTATGIEIRWLADEAIKPPFSFIVYRKMLPENAFRKIAEVKTGISRFVDQKTTPGKTYIYTVSLSSGGNESRKSSEKVITR